MTYIAIGALAFAVGYWLGWWNRKRRQRAICNDCARIAQWQATRHVKPQRGGKP